MPTLRLLRTQGNPLKTLSQFMPASSSPADMAVYRRIWVREDGYVWAYQGREYVVGRETKALEVMSVAFEYALGPTDKFELLLEKDPEMLSIVLGLLRGDNGL